MPYIAPFTSLKPASRENAKQHSAEAIKPPDWFTCGWEKFRDYWLAGWENKTIPRPTSDELDLCDRWMNS